MDHDVLKAALARTLATLALAAVAFGSPEEHQKLPPNPAPSMTSVVGGASDTAHGRVNREPQVTAAPAGPIERERMHLVTTAVVPSAPSVSAAESDGAPTATAKAHKPRRPVSTVAVQVALAQVGKPYVWGAVGPHSFDCSGLVQYAYGKAGIELPRTTWDQMNVGRQIQRSDLRPGDLVFFLDGRHVGLYIGGGKIVHAPHSGANVRVVSLDVMVMTSAVRLS